MIKYFCDQCGSEYHTCKKPSDVPLQRIERTLIDMMVHLELVMPDHKGQICDRCLELELLRIAKSYSQHTSHKC